VHRIWRAQIVGGNAGIDVVTGIDVDAAVEDVRGGIGDIDAGDQRLGEIAAAAAVTRLRPGTDLWCGPIAALGHGEPRDQGERRTAMIALLHFPGAVPASDAASIADKANRCCR
jgi:hypothetical protein